jgi:hypothetical protein
MKSANKIPLRHFEVLYADEDRHDRQPRNYFLQPRQPDNMGQ